MIRGVGTTATFSAVARAVGTNKGLINDPFAEPLVRASGVKYFIRLVEDQRYAADGDDGGLPPSILDILAAHSRFLDEFLADAGRAGIRQVVILGSGLDSRPYRLWWPRGTTVYEVDRPEVLDLKSEVLRAMGAKPTANRREVGIDLRQDWLAALRRIGFDDAQRTVWIAEQLLVGYLSPDAHQRLLHDATAASAEGSRFAADYLATWSPVQIEGARALIEGWRRQGVDVDLASLTHAGEYRYVPEYLAAHGWKTVERNVVDLLNAIGMAGVWRGSPDELAESPRYVTATRSRARG